ncbi:MAG: carboxypeptidase-like regulatory domain-containing protein [Flavobacteriales bacterium]
MQNPTKRELGSSKCKTFLLLAHLLLFHLVSFSQIQISGTVTDSTHTPLPYTNIQVLRGDSLLTYAISDEKGAYKTAVKASGTYIFKVSHMGYKTLLYQREISGDTLLSFILPEDIRVLDEIVVKAKSLDVSLKGDTIRYNLKRAVNGTEENLKDMLEKLPGLEVDEKGEIRAGGQTIDNLLINGKKIFGGQHRLATENISAEMIQGVELIRNFKAFSDLENATRTGKTALNVDIKKKYMGKIGGDFLLQGGYRDGYVLHTNLYKFDEKANWFFIGDVNNLGRRAFTIEDYLNFSGTLDELLNGDSKIAVRAGDDLPAFLFSDDDVKNRTTRFSALNLSANPTNKVRIHAFSIFNHLDQRGLAEKTSTFFTAGNPIIYDEKIGDRDTCFFNNTFLEMTYKPSKNAVLHYTATYAPLDDKSDKTIENNGTRTDALRNKKGGAFGQFLKYRQRVDKRSFFAVTCAYNRSKKDETLTLDSDASFLSLPFIDDDFSTTQYVAAHHTHYGVETEYARSFKHFSLDLNYCLTKRQNEYASLSADDLSPQNRIEIDRTENVFGIGWYKRDRSLLNYNFGVDYKIVDTKRPELQKVYRFLPRAEIGLHFTRTHSVTLSYKKEAKFADSKNLVENPVISNYRSVFVNDDVSAWEVSALNGFGMRYFYYDLFSQTLLGLVGNYDRNKNAISLDSRNRTDYVVNHYVISPSETHAHALVTCDKKFGKIPFSIRLNTRFSLIERTHYIEGKNNEITSKIIHGDVKISSLFDKSKINFETGIKVDNHHIAYQINDTRTHLTEIKPFFNLNGFLKNAVWKVDFLVENYKSKSLHTTNFMLSPSIVFKRPKKNWEFSLSGDNILHINNTQRIENTNVDNLFEERKYAALAGNIVFGIKYKI